MSFARLMHYLFWCSTNLFTHGSDTQDLVGDIYQGIHGLYNPGVNILIIIALYSILFYQGGWSLQKPIRSFSRSYTPTHQFYCRGICLLRFPLNAIKTTLLTYSIFHSYPTKRVHVLGVRAPAGVFSPLTSMMGVWPPVRRRSFFKLYREMFLMKGFKFSAPIFLENSRSMPCFTALRTVSTVTRGAYAGSVPSWYTPVLTRIEYQSFLLFALNSFVPLTSLSGVSPTKYTVSGGRLMRCSSLRHC
jgi:hypothetical protein